jgi:hypothetical protein
LFVIVVKWKGGTALLIVIEGPDLTGKTTLARRIAEMIDGTIRHSGPPTRHPIEEYQTALDGYDPRGDQHLILDRWHVGEHVWPKVFGRKTEFDLAVARHVDMFMESRGALVVYADRNKDLLKQELEGSNEPVSPGQVDQIVDLFRDARLFSEKVSLPWDYETGTDDDISKIVETARYKAREARTVWRACGPAFVTGSFAPAVLLVGDEQGPEREGRRPPAQVPFAPYRATSGHYLMNCLETWRRTAIVNATDRDTGYKYRLSDIYEALGEPKVLALGKNAAGALRTDAVPHDEVPHPQYWRRFKYGSKSEYGKLISGGTE